MTPLNWHEQENVRIAVDWQTLEALPYIFKAKQQPKKKDVIQIHFYLRT